MHDPCLAGALRNDKGIRKADGSRCRQPREIVGIPHNRDIAWAICAPCLGEAGGMRVADDHSTDIMLVVSLSFRAQPHKRGEVLSAIDETAERMRQASGCLRCRLLIDNEDCNVFTVASEWESLATAEAFFASREFQTFKGVRILLREEPVMVFDDVRSRVTRLIRAR